MGSRSRSRERGPRSYSDVATTELDSDSAPPTQIDREPQELENTVLEMDPEPQQQLDNTVVEIVSSPEPPQPPDDDQPIIPVAHLPRDYPDCILPYWRWTNFPQKFFNAK